MVVGTPASAQTIGVNYTNGDRNSAAQQTADLAHMAAAGVHTIRVSWEKWNGDCFGNSKYPETKWKKRFTDYFYNRFRRRRLKTQCFFSRGNLV